jgi:hypothetical protein
VTPSALIYFPNIYGHPLLAGLPTTKVTYAKPGCGEERAILVFHRRAYLTLILLGVLLTETWLHWSPDARGQGSPSTKEKLDEKTICALIAQLGDDSFTKRDEAQQKLVAAGKYGDLAVNSERPH